MSFTVCIKFDRGDMAQAVSRHPTIAEARGSRAVIPCEICDGESSTETDVSPISSVSLASISSTWFHTHMSSQRCKVGKMISSVRRRNITPST
jgi:hypothetical protein